MVGKSAWASLSGTKKNKEDELILELIEELRAKEYDDEFIVQKVTMKVGAQGATRVTALLSGKTDGGSNADSGAPADKPFSQADQARANAAKKKAKVSLVGKS